ncbi:hypothetical protein LAZ67_9002254 [Cordylochernes scorpioides]|uniref:ATP-dependent DNA helicase n=1 Tax=Cordylochernes scorpioides TaxID=51811 RepID=A0ABY6KTQ7_9ARAC|nr:hypothetical protein LAZ67_9002254 [Cordylochernes scorpioides]
MRQRLEWCRARSAWMTEWHRVVFSDESRFCLSSDSRRVRVWRRRGERSNPAAIVERPTVRQRGIMVWGAIAYDSRSPLLRIQGTMTAQRYIDDVLRPVTLPYLQGVPNALYQQDNARPHTARISQQALQDVQMLPWPPYSPDLSPIEHVWDIIGRRLHALPQPRSEDELWQMESLRTIVALSTQQNLIIKTYDVKTAYLYDEIVMEYNQEEERILGNAYISNLNSQQKKIFDIVINSVENNAENQRLFCVDGPAGTGKTFLFQTLMCFLRGAGKIVLPCASTGIAATLLKGGRTYHSLFKLPIPLNETSIANFDKDSNLKNEIISSSLIIWDEISMAIGYALTAIDRKLRDVMRDERPFGGKAQIIESTIKRNPLWCHVKSEKLTLNMRTKDEVIFAEYLLKVGEGELLNDYNLPQNIIEVPRAMISSGDLNSEIFAFQYEKFQTATVLGTPASLETFQYGRLLLASLNQMDSSKPCK